MDSNVLGYLRRKILVGQEEENINSEEVGKVTEMDR